MTTNATNFIIRAMPIVLLFATVGIVLIISAGRLKNEKKIGFGKSGFTVVELVICLTIIGILATITVPIIGGVLSSSRDKQRSSKVTLLAESLEKYYQDNGEYPTCDSLTQPAEVVVSNTLKGLSPDVLAAPGAAAGTNSITCGDVAVSNFAYKLDVSGSYTITYGKEADNSTTVVDSRYGGSAMLGGAVLTANASSTTQIDLSWTAVTDAVEYRVQKATDISFNNNMTEVVTRDLSKSYSGLTSGVRYYFRVMARAVNAKGSWVAANAVTLIATPASPTVTTSTVGSTTTYSWATTSCSVGSPRYQYRYTINSGYDSGLVTISTNSVVFTTATEGYTYNVAVQTQCYTSDTSSSWSSAGSATYTRPYSVAVLAGTGGSVSGGGNYIPGSVATIVATPNVGYVFSGWTGSSGCSGTASHSLTVDGTKSCTASFTVSNYTITLSTSGRGNYTYCSDENGTCSFTGTSNVRYGAYSGWSYKYNVSGSVACSNANFGDPLPNYVKTCQYQAPVSVSGAGTFSGGTTRTISASPSGSFDSWTGGTGCSGAASHSFVLGANTTCTANFSNHLVDSPVAPNVSASFVSNNAVLSVDAVSCAVGTPEYKIRFLRSKYTSDSSWTAWTSWSTTRSMSQVALQGNKHTFEVVAHCNSGGTYSADSPTASTNIVMDIGTPEAPTYAGPSYFNNGEYHVVNFVSYCPTGTDLVNGTFVSNLDSTENIWGPHPFGFNDYWTNWEGYTLTATYWGTYQCQTSFAVSPLSPQGVTQVPVYSG